MRILIFLFILALTIGCSNKAKTKAKLDFVTSFSNVLGPLSAGGALVHGVNSDTNETLTIFPNGNGEEISLANGQWSFQALIWEGPNKMEGTLRCGTTTANLSGNDVTISLTIDQASCNNANLLDTGATTSGQPHPIRFANCNNLGSISSGADDCNSNLGTFNSYKISLLPSGDGIGLYSPLFSECINDAGLLSGLTTSALRIPFLTFVQKLSRVNIIAFAEASCAGATTTFNSSQGVESLSPNAKSFYDGTYTTVYLSKNAAGTSTGSLPYLTPKASVVLSSTTYKSNIKIQVKAKNKNVGSSTNYKFNLSSKTYPEKVQQKVSTNYKFILGN